MTRSRSITAAMAAACLLGTAGVASAGEFVPVPEDSAENASLGESLDVEQDGVTATFKSEGGSLAVAGKAGKQVGLGIAGNKANAINVGETLVVTFNRDVTLSQIDFGYVGDEDLVVVTIAGADGEVQLKLGGEAGDAELPKGAKVQKNYRFVKLNGKAAVTVKAGSAIRITSESSTDNTFFVKSITAEPAGDESA